MSAPIRIILPVHNRSWLTARFIDSLCQQTDRNFRLLLVDDGCTDDTVKMVTSRLPDVELIQGDGNLWWAASVQNGIDHLVEQGADGDTIVLIANDDTTFAANFLANARAWIDANPHSLLQAVPVDPDTNLAIDHGISIDWRYLSLVPAAPGAIPDCLSTRGLFSRLSDILKAGQFQRQGLPHYFSDFEFTIRAKRKGLGLATSPDVWIFVSRQTTGIRSTRSLTWIQFIKVIFTKRCSLNPFYYSMFILLCAPARFMPIGLIRVWAGFFVDMAKSVKLSFSRSRI